MDIALGSGATGVFTNSSWLWNRLSEVGTMHGDPKGGGDYAGLSVIYFLNPCSKVTFML